MLWGQKMCSRYYVLKKTGGIDLEILNKSNIKF